MILWYVYFHLKDYLAFGRKSGLVVIVLDSQLQGHGFKYHTILDGNGVKAMLGSISATNSG